MSDVFVSYARSTSSQAQAIAEALQALGYEVWRDDELPAHRDYSEVIEERLRASKAVVVVWSAEAVKSQWVRAEADVAREAGTLVQLSLDGIMPPLPFNRIQCADLNGWNGELGAAGWRKVIDSVAALAGHKARSPEPAARPAPAPPAPPRSDKISIAVLPFANLSGDPEQEYFSDGISEDIITDLSKVSALAVASRNTSFTFKNKSIAVTQAARDLSVTYVLEGSVRKVANRVRITAQLIEGATDTHVWAERYDRDLDDIFAVQDEISRAIVDALKVRLAPDEKKAIAQRSTGNPEAYKLYLMARRHWIGAGGSDRYRDLIIRLCQKAIELDPSYARAWALMAINQASRPSTGEDRDDRGWSAAERALSLDPALPEAHAAKSRLLIDQGRAEEAAAEIELALRLDPTSFEVNNGAAYLAIATRRYEDAIRYYEAAGVADDAAFAPRFMAIQCYEALGDSAGAQATAREAVARLEKLAAAEPDNGGAYAYGSAALVILGEMERAKAWAEHALLLEPNDGLVRYNLACGMVRAGEFDYALDLIEAAFKRLGPDTVRWAQIDTDFDPLRSLPRFEAIMAEAEARLGTSILPTKNARAGAGG
jgi:adenylate cyclase